ncbi:hypothetical protein FHL15_006681 [Xylaria flabelliformis]|uniref:2EXR domain-containing protein n=1 Tax=Xylaria flabelliformis TaxID=2512241 RepID=A0A553HX41_9PEZI|nr:hypothetical protein FHL15_006681 [Xylaria flabelliformis]
MPDQSERDDDLSSDATGTPVEQDFDESETEEEEEEGDFFDLEAEESDGYEDENGNEADDDYDHRSEHYYFPQFSRLPPELRAMIWEALDPDLKSKARVLDFIVIKKAPRDGGFDIWESATLAQQTAPARAVLATCRESRCIALGYYPDTIQLRHGLGEIRFNSANDIILLRLPQDLRGSDIYGLGRWCSKIKYLAFDNGLESYPTPRHLPALNDPPQGLETIFSCFDARTFGHRLLDWSVSKSSKQFYVETFEEQSGLGEDIKALYCWPDTTLHTDFVDQVGSDYMLKFPEMPAIGSIPVWPMAQYLFDDGLVLYQKAKRHYERNIGRENGSGSPLESSEGESFYESEPDDYVRDGFIVDSSSEESEETSNDEDDRLIVDGLRGSSDHEDSDQDLDDFNGFSPLQNSSDDEATSGLRNVTSVAHDVSLEEQPRAENQSSRRKRRIVSSEDESDDDDDVVVEVHSRVTSKRPRFISSDSEGDEDGSRIDARPGAEGSSRLRKRARIILSDSEDGEDDKYIHNEGHQLSEHSLHGDEDDDDDEDGGTEEEEDSDEEDEDLQASKPMSLLARLRQFRSDVPISPEGESTSSSQDQDEEERYEDEDGQRFSDAEFPESPDEEGDQDGW